MNLYIDTHLDDLVVIISKNNKIVKKEIIKGERMNSTKLMPLIKKIVPKNELESIVVVNGPGSFTGVRIGVTIAKTLAYTLDIPIYTVTSLECMAISLESDERIVAFCDKNGYYVGIFDGELNLFGEYAYIKNDEYENFSKKYQVFTDVTLNYEKIIKYALGKKAINAHAVNPIYIKRFDVEK